MYATDAPGMAAATAPPVRHPGPPSSFMDARGRRWDVLITAAHLIDFRDTAGVDLAAAILAGDMPRALFDEPERLVMLLWIACEQQAVARGMSPEEFGRSIFAKPPGRLARLLKPAHGFRPDAYQGGAVAAFRAIARLYPDTAFGAWVRATGGRSTPRR